MLPAGAFGDRWGRKRLPLTGLALFGAASLVAGWADFASLVIAVRAVMAVGAAIIMPIVLAVLTVLFTGPERGRAISLVVIGIGAGLPLRPIVGGHLLEHFWWASIFLINVPVVAAMAAASAAAGRPVVSMRARYPADNRLPSRATPSAPATWRTAMVIAVPAPDGCGGRTARRPGRNADSPSSPNHSGTQVPARRRRPPMRQLPACRRPSRSTPSPRSQQSGIRHVATLPERRRK